MEIAHRMLTPGALPARNTALSVVFRQLTVLYDQKSHPLLNGQPLLPRICDYLVTFRIVLGERVL